MAEQLILPRAILDTNGDPVSGAKLYAYLEGTTTLETVYADEGLTTPHPSPLAADAGGNFPPVWHQGDHGVKVRIDYASDVELSWSPLDPCPITSSATTAENISYTPTANNPANNVQEAIENASELGAEVITRAANFTATTAEQRKVILCTADLTMAISAASVLGNGWFVDIKASGGNVTVDPDGSETINGLTTDTIPDGQTARVFTDGTSFYWVLSGPPTEIWTLLWDHSVDGDMNLIESPQLRDGFSFQMVGSRVTMDQAGALGIQVTFNGDASPASGVAASSNFCNGNANENEFIVDFGHVRRAEMTGRLFRAWRGPSNTDMDTTPKILGDREGDTFTVSAIDSSGLPIDKVGVYAQGGAVFDGGKIWGVERRVNYA